jgi:hypothetical protein
MRKVILTGAIALVLVLALTSVALAATPWDIYQDYSADGHLDGTYTNAELRAYLNSAYVDQYGDPVILTALDAIVTNLLAARDRFPFTGAKTALAVLGLCGLVGAGMGLRRLARVRT